MKRNFSLLFILVLALFIRLPSYFKPHIENDEVIYQTLVNNINFSISSYSLQGQDILKFLPDYIYNKEIFHHPPLFVYLGKAFNLLLGPKSTILVSILANTTTIYFVWKICHQLFKDPKKQNNIALISSLILAFDPLNVFVSSKIWSDSLLTMFLMGSFYFSLRPEKSLWQFLFLSLAVLTKTIAFVIFPVILGIHIAKYKLNFKYLWPIILASLVGLAWIYIYHSHTSIYYLDVRANAKFISSFPYVAKVVNRPFIFYFFQILLLNPIYLFGYYFLTRIFSSEHTRSTNFLGLVVYGLAYLLVFTIIGINGGSFQMRYILPVIPPLAIITATYLSQNKTLTTLALSVFVPIMLISTLLNTYILLIADPISIFGIHW